MVPTGGTTPVPAGVSSVTDALVTITCPGDAFTLQVQAAGGGGGAYTYSWERNGIAVPGLALANTLNGVQGGIYTVDVSVDITGLDIPLGKLAADLVCTTSFGFEVREPSVMTVREKTDRRIVPACTDDTATLVFEVIGGNDNAGPYTLNLGALTGTSANATTREIVISGIDTQITSQFEAYDISDALGCQNASTLTSSITLPSFKDVSFQINQNDIDCANGIEGSIEIVLADGTPDISTIGVQISSDAPVFNYFINWESADAGGVVNSIKVDIQNAGVYDYRIIGIPEPGTTTNTTSTNTTICELDSGSVEIKEADNNQILLRDIERILPGCNQDFGTINLVFDENTLPPTMSIVWQKQVSIATVVSKTLTTTQVINVKEFRNIPELNGRISASPLENGTYKAIISPNTTGSCPNIPIPTPNIVIGQNEGLKIQNVSYVETAANNYCTDPLLLRYNIQFRLDNNLDAAAGNAFNISLAKTSDYGDTYFKEFSAATNAGITRPTPVRDGSGLYIIPDVPFGEYDLMVGTDTPTVCEVTQVIIIPEVEPLTFVGDPSYVIDPCLEEVVITADVTGGIEFPGGGYFYDWTLVTNGGDIRRYSGEEIIVREAGLLSLSVTDGANCTYAVVAAGAEIIVNESVVPYRIEPKVGIDTDGDGVDDKFVLSAEPTCQNAAKDDGLISFDINGGDLPTGGVMPYEIKWEKYDVVAAAFIEMNGNGGLPDLAGQRFSNNLTPGQYRVSVAPRVWLCPLISKYANIGLIEYITVPQNDDLVVTNGPFIISSQYDFKDPTKKTICDVGGAGNLYVEIFDNYEGDLEFYYPDKAPTSLLPHKQLDGKLYELPIAATSATGSLTVVNEEGCQISVIVNLEIGVPSFNYTSLNAQQTGTSSSGTPLINAREDVTFTNNSTGTFTYLEWDFGDGSSVERNFPFTGTTSPVIHEYGIDGTYYVTLRLFNSVGCFEEIIKIVNVGKGYNILVPNVFTPEDSASPDKQVILNNYFKPLFSGFEYIQLTIYDYRGNMVYTEDDEADPANPFKAVILEGWNGKPFINSPYYIYSVFGITSSTKIEVTKSGTFIIIRDE